MKEIVIRTALFCIGFYFGLGVCSLLKISGSKKKKGKHVG